MIRSPFPGWSAIEWRRHLPGAQTERRGGAGPVGGLLGGKDPTGRLISINSLGGRGRQSPARQPNHPQYASAGTTSPPARVTKAAKMRMFMPAFGKRTEPSAKTALA